MFDDLIPQASASAPHGGGMFDDLIPKGGAEPQDEAAPPASGHLQTGTSPFASGLVEPGNVELWNRPVLHNGDGSYSTTSSLSFDEGGKEVLIPTVVGGKRLTPTEAIRHYRQSGGHLGKFATAEAADKYAETLHQSQAANYDQAGNPIHGAQGAPTSGGQGSILDPFVQVAQAKIAQMHAAPAAAPPPPNAAPTAGFSQFQNRRGPLTTRNITIGTAPETPDMMQRQKGLLAGIPEGAAASVPGLPGEVEALGRIALSPLGVSTKPSDQIFPTVERSGDIMFGKPSNDANASGRVIGSFVGPSVAAKGAEMVARGGLAVAQRAARLAGPFTDSGRERIAGERIANAATDLPAVKQSLERADEIVPGSKPTTFQASGDMGLGGLERQSQTKYPAEFNQRRADQNAARIAQLDKLQKSGDPADFVDYVKTQMRWLDGETEGDVASATKLAQQRAEAVGGTKTPEDYGAGLRGSMQGGEDAARGQEKALWQAVDPDGKLTVPTSPIRTMAKVIDQGMSKSAKPISGEERGILDIALAYNPTEPFQEIGDLRSRVSTAMREELRSNGRTPVYARLTRLRGAVERAITTGVETQAQQAPEDLAGEFARFEQEARNWSRDSSVGRASNVAYDATGTGGVSSVQGTRSQGRGRPGNVADNPGVPEAPTFDPGAAERLGLANDATKARADTYGRGPVGQALAKAGRQDQYRLPDSAVPAKIFHPGARGFEDVAAFRKAAGDDQALETLQDYAASSLRKAAMREDGTLDPTKVASWQARHSDALRAFPGLQAKFKTAADASDAIASATAGRKAALGAYQAGSLARVVGLNDPADITRTIGGIFGSKNAVQQMADFASTARRNPDAMEGLRKAVADHIQQKFISNTEAATSGESLLKGDAFQSFVRANRDALSQVFSPEEIGALKAIADDLRRSNRSLNAVRIPGQSNTAQDVIAAGKGGGSVLGRLVAEGATAMAGAAGTLASGTISGGALSWLGAKTITIMRDAGIQRVDELVRDAMLNPEVAKALLAKVPDKPSPTFQAIFAGRLKRALQTGPAASLLNRSGSDASAR